jgi:simple sugar transport system permease protein
MACGMAMAAIYGVITVYMKQQQVVTGTALNILAAGICAFFQRVIFGIPTTPLQIATLPKIAIPLLSKIPFLGPIFFNQNILTYIAYLLIPVAIFVLFKTSLGLTLRSTGENPEAVDVAGINVNRVRFFAVLVAGAISGLAGSFYTVGYLGMFTTSIIGGRGWIAFAICFLGNWNPKGVVLGTLAFGLADAIAIYIQAVSGSTIFPNELIIALPYILTILLTIFRSNFNVPAKLGVPYTKES